MLPAERTALVPPRPHRVEADDEEPVGAVGRLGRLPLPLELRATGRVKRAGKVYGMSWLPGIASSGGPSERRNAAARSCWSRRPRCVRSPLAITSSGWIRSSSGLHRPLQVAVLVRAEVEVGDVEDACHVGRSRLYSDAGVNESTEIFDDLYLGLRAGGAMRKQRRGEPLTAEEEEALGRWQRLSTWRKAVAIGAFAVGTFGLGFTLGGLIFGRWRKA